VYNIQLEGAQQCIYPPSEFFHSCLELGRETVPHYNWVSISSRFRNNGP